MPLGKGKTGRDEIDLYALGQVLAPPATYARQMAVLEKVQTRPGQGISSAFRFGEGFGAIRMALVGFSYEDRLVTPATWKAHFGLSRDKGVSRSYAASRFPKYAQLFARAKDDGRAEAALLALYGMEKLLPTYTNKTA